MSCQLHLSISCLVLWGVEIRLLTHPFALAPLPGYLYRLFAVTPDGWMLKGTRHLFPHTAIGHVWHAVDRAVPDLTSGNFIGTVVPQPQRA